MPRGPGETYGRLEQELQAERAAALGRIGRTLEELLAALEDLRTRIDASSGADRPALISRHVELRARAATYRWYLEVQREAIGLRRHHHLDEMYPLPPPLV